MGSIAEKLLQEADLEEADDSPFLEGSSSAKGANVHDTASPLSRLLFLWFNSVLKVGFSRQLNHEDLPLLPAEDAPAAVAASFQETWLVAAPGPGRLGRTLLQMERRNLLRGGAAKLVHDSVMFASPATLNALLKCLGDGCSASRGSGYVVVLTLTALVQSVAVAQYFHYGFRQGMRMRASLVLAIYDKSLRLSPAARGAFTQGEVLTFLSADAKRIQDAAPYAQMVWSGPYQIGLSILMLSGTLGTAFWSGVGVILAIIPLSALLTSVVVKLQGRLMVAKDARVSRTAEALGAIKLLKSAGWEQGFGVRVTAARALELGILTKSVGLEMLFGCLWESVPLLVALVAFLDFTSRGGILTAANVFTSLALFDLIRFPLLVFPEMMSNAANCTVSLRRVQAFLEAEELPPPALHVGGPLFRAVDAEFSWHSESGRGAAVLSHVSLSINPGELLLVVGAVGSGKSTLVAGLLGELAPATGTLTRRAGPLTLSYCAQTAFIVAGTLRENITFGAPFDESRYAQVIAASALTHDISALPQGDATLIGEHGVNLSGGQRQRVALARAGYRRADVYIFDDPLSALDASVGRHVFDAMLSDGGLLSGSARVLVTHGAQYLPQAGRILLLAESRVIADGAPASVFATCASRPELNALLHAESACVDNAMDQQDKAVAHVMPAKVEEAQAAEPAGADSSAEQRREGRVKWDVYAYYLRAAGLLQSAGVVSLFVAWTALLAGSKLWLARWAGAGGRYSSYWSGGYISLGMASLAVLLCRQLLRTLSQVRGGRRLHEQLLHGVLRARLSFFTATPSGRILNRFAGDAGVADERLHDDACDALRQACSVGAALCVVASVTPPLLLGVPPVVFAYSKVQTRYAASARELQRLESVARSPIFSGCGEALSGASTIRAFGEAERFERTQAEHLGAHMRAYFACQTANRWLALRSESLAAAIVAASASAALQAGGRIAPGLAGLSISYSLQVCSALSWLVRAVSMVENEIVSVERMQEYAETLPPEPPLVIADSRPPRGWPHAGALSLRGVGLRYAPSLPYILRNVNAEIRGGEKIGVVGRTGAGKSSLLLALLRLADEAGCEGRILLDGLDIRAIGVGDLRDAISVVPQEGTLFAGSLRFNLDPLAAASDAQLLEALKLVGLSEANLEEPVSEHGGNWSAGQRQLLCLARAALRHSRLVLVDEATSSCDGATDLLCQSAMRTAFASATVLTVAHRIGTVTSCDRIMVMNAGAVAEFDSPAKLVSTGGIFATLYAESQRGVDTGLKVL